MDDRSLISPHHRGADYASASVQISWSVSLQPFSRSRVQLQLEYRGVSDGISSEKDGIVLVLAKKNRVDSV